MFQVYDRIDWSGTKCDVLKVAKNGRLYVSFWCPIHHTKLVKMWIYPTRCTLIRKAR